MAATDCSRTPPRRILPRCHLTSSARPVECPKCESRNCEPARFTRSVRSRFRTGLTLISSPSRMLFRFFCLRLRCVSDGAYEYPSVRLLLVESSPARPVSSVRLPRSPGRHGLQDQRLQHRLVDIGELFDVEASFARSVFAEFSQQSRGIAKRYAVDNRCGLAG